MLVCWEAQMKKRFLVGPENKYHDEKRQTDGSMIENVNTLSETATETVQRGQVSY